jgi:hypothetical protein
MRQVIINIPQAIPSPQFLPFQRIRRQDGKIGTIVGMQYTAFVTALKDGSSQGWDYAIDWVLGLSEEEILNSCVGLELYPEESLESWELLEE